MRYRRFIVSAVAVIFVTLLGSSIAFAQAALTDDAHTNNSPKAIDSNYSTNPNIQISSSTNAYVKFKISPTLPANTSGSDVARATLKLYIGAVNTPGKVDVFRVTSPWDEATITAVNAPTLGNL